MFEMSIFFLSNMFIYLTSRHKSTITATIKRTFLHKDGPFFTGEMDPDRLMSEICYFV